MSKSSLSQNEIKKSVLRVPRKILRSRSKERLEEWLKSLATRMFVTCKPQGVYLASDHVKRDIPADAGDGIVITGASLAQSEAEFRMVNKLRQFDMVPV